MKIEIRIDETCTEPRVLILTDRVTEQVNDLFKRLSESRPQAIAGFRDDMITVLAPEDIIRFYGAQQKVFAQTDRGEYTVRLRLYELEERLDQGLFVRISHSEIINIKKVINMDLSIAGTIRINLHGGSTSFVSRRYVAKIKTILEI